MAIPFCISTSLCESSTFSPTFCYCQTKKNSSPSNICVVISCRGLNLHFPNNNVDHLFLCVYLPLYIFFSEVSFKSFAFLFELGSFCIIKF